KLIIQIQFATFKCRVREQCLRALWHFPPKPIRSQLKNLGSGNIYFLPKSFSMKLKRQSAYSRVPKAILPQGLVRQAIFLSGSQSDWMRIVYLIASLQMQSTIR